MEIKKTKKADLENKKGLFFEIGLIVTLLLMVLAFTWSTKDVAVDEIQITKQVNDEEDIEATQEEQPEVQTVAPVPVAVPTEIVIDESATIADLNLVDPEDSKDMKIEEVKVVKKKEIKQEEEKEDDVPFALVEDKPKFQGGDENTFRNWVNKNIVYPESAIEAGVSGKVVLQFTVDKSGKVTKVIVLRKVDPALDKEAVRVVSSSPLWTPGKQRNKAVPVVFQFPVQFQLNN